jgi:hypothetical protein
MLGVNNFSSTLLIDWCEIVIKPTLMKLTKIKSVSAINKRLYSRSPGSARTYPNQSGA